MLEHEKTHLAMLRGQLSECTVLLKSNGDFPLDHAGKLALYGSGARHTIKGGTGSGEVNSRFFVTAEQGLREAGFEITTSSWLDAYDRAAEAARLDFVKEIKRRARKNHTLAIVEGMGAVMPEPEYQIPLDGDGDTAVYVLSRISGEGNDRQFVPGDILLSQTEQRDILALSQQYARFLLVLNVGGPVDLTPVMEVGNILLLSQLGVETGSVLADLLLGKSYPSGKLTATWASRDRYPSVGEFGDINDTRYREGVYVGYRYFDSVAESPLFPFGHGLGYTQFSLSGGDVHLDGETVTVKTRAANTGKRAGKQTVQLYVSVPEGVLDQPMQALAAFAKTGELLPGREEDITLCFCMSELASYDTAAAAYVLEPGDYILRLGVSSRDTAVIGVLSLPERCVVRQVKNCLGTPDFPDWKPEKKAPADIPENTVRIAVSPADIPSFTVDYHAEEDLDLSEAAALSDEELCYLAVGAFDPRGGVLSIVGNAAKSVAGAAGETTSQLQKRGIRSLVMADGPAGLRLSRDYAEDAKGVHSLGAAIPETMLEYLPSPVRSLLRLTNGRPAADAVIKHQYCTAIPIGTAVAQSWNPAFAERCGDIVGAEMEKFGVHLWLAPALNIQRSIQCGRNFEYFSEDPLISGIFAAAITAGVQSHPGCGTTVKHFAANNQETNRYNSNSQVSERAMREIYLRAFDLCVRRSRPYALMTSYNLLNGTHTSEREDLTEDILRREFGFEGLVMTDWIIRGGTMNRASLYPAPEPWKVSAAGGNLYMPGGRKEFRNILKALRTGVLPRAQMTASAARVLRILKELAL